MAKLQPFSVWTENPSPSLTTDTFIEISRVTLHAAKPSTTGPRESDYGECHKYIVQFKTLRMEHVKQACFVSHSASFTWRANLHRREKKHESLTEEDTNTEPEDCFITCEIVTTEATHIYVNTV